MVTLMNISIYIMFALLNPQLFVRTNKQVRVSPTSHTHTHPYTPTHTHTHTHTHPPVNNFKFTANYRHARVVMTYFCFEPNLMSRDALNRP